VVDVRRGLRVALEGGGALFFSGLIVVTSVEAAVVTRVRAASTTSTTKIVVDLDGPFRHDTRIAPDGKSIVVEIAGSRLGERATRVLPVSDARVDGVVVSFDKRSNAVRLSIDLAGRVAPEVETEVEGDRLVVSLSPAAPTHAQTSTGPTAVGRSPSATTPRPAGKPPVDLRHSAKPSAAARASASGGASHELPAGAGRRAVEAPRHTAPPASRTPTPSPASAHSIAAGASSSSRPASAASPTRRSIVEKVLVVIDPGHGGKDPGAKAWTGEFEKDIVLDLAERVARRLRESGEVEVAMTRSGDQYVSLADRRESSRRWGAAAFVSIHANASPSAAARGIETYYHAGSSDRAVRRLARAENGGRTERSGARLSPASAASPLARQAESARLAESVQGQLVHQLGMRYEAVRDLGAKEGPFFVIGENAAPAVLVEAAFLTHREEGLRMRSEVYRERIAAGVARGILAFLEEQKRVGAL
jgi:N-acetylmuramoyl-L-alanine amidase